jgi:hypothetical protein
MKILRGSLSRQLLLSAIFLSLSAPLTAQETATATATPATAEVQAVSPEAQAVVNRMTSYLHGLNTYSITSDSTRDEVVAFGYKLQHNQHSITMIQRPNKLRADISGDLRNRTIVYNGAGLTMYSPDENVYVRTGAPDNLGTLIGGLLDAGVEMPMIDVLYQAYDGSLTADARGGVLVGDATIDGVECDHLAFRQASIDWQLWVEKGARPLPRKIVITTRYEVGDPQYQATLRWNLQPTIDKATFEFVAPKDAVEIPFLESAAIEGTSP